MFYRHNPTALINREQVEDTKGWTIWEFEATRRKIRNGLIDRGANPRPLGLKRGKKGH